MKTDRDNHLWLKLWRDRQTDFHQYTVNKFLMTFWPSLGLIKGSRIFVPLCGKSLDMVWLAEQGYEVIGVELSPVAVKAFFRENRMKPEKRCLGKFTIWQHNRIRILCGDYFSLIEADIGQIDAIYDRAALTALPEDLRTRYVTQLQQIAPQTNIFLLTIEDIDEGVTLLHEPHVDEEVNSLYSKDFDINLAHAERFFENDPHAMNQPPVQTEHKLYQLSSKLGLK